MRRGCAGWMRNARSLMVERGPYVSYANCGLPYHVGGAIEKESSLLVATEATFREQFAIDCRTRCEVVGISSGQKTVDLKNHVTGEVTTEHYDKPWQRELRSARNGRVARTPAANARTAGFHAPGGTRSFWRGGTRPVFPRQPGPASPHSHEDAR